MTSETTPATFRIDVPLKRDREAAEEQRREFLTKILYVLGGILVFALLVFVVYRFAYPY